jgi:uncharacterized membrane protein YfcA
MILLLVGAAAFVAGFINTMAGGGSFLTFSALVAAGLPPIAANASSSVALFPGQIATAFAARDGLRKATHNEQVNVRALSVISLVGGSFGGFLLLVTSPSVFSAVVPWLVLFATMVFAGGSFLRENRLPFKLGSTGILFVQAILAIYCGYFGGGGGILMLATLTVYGLRDIWLMTSLKILFASLTNVAAVITFVFAGLIHWPETIVMAIAALSGGYIGLHTSRRLPPSIVKAFVTLIGFLLSLYFFVKPALLADS